MEMAQQPNAAQPMPMSFFVTSSGSGKGADLRGLAGADQLCKRLAAATGSTKTWHAYLSTQAADGKGRSTRAIESAPGPGSARRAPWWPRASPTGMAIRSTPRVSGTI
jgi:hypothetical protein